VKVREVNRFKASNAIYGFTCLIAKHALLSLGMMLSICCFHDKVESIICPRNLIVLTAVIYFHSGPPGPLFDQFWCRIEVNYLNLFIPVCIIIYIYVY
jgi:hypothetical protein